MRSTATRAKRLRVLALLAAGGAAYAAFALRFGGLPCPFHALTGLRCPGCGVTTLLLSLVRGDLAAAFWANPFLFLSAPFLLVLLWRFLWKDTLPGRRWHIAAWVYLASLVLWGIFRNIAGI